jgi:hypothetical protein
MHGAANPQSIIDLIGICEAHYRAKLEQWLPSIIHTPLYPNVKQLGITKKDVIYPVRVSLDETAGVTQWFKLHVGIHTTPKKDFTISNDPTNAIWSLHSSFDGIIPTSAWTKERGERVRLDWYVLVTLPRPVFHKPLDYDVNKIITWDIGLLMFRSHIEGHIMSDASPKGESPNGEVIPKSLLLGGPAYHKTGSFDVNALVEAVKNFVPINEDFVPVNQGKF